MGHCNAHGGGGKRKTPAGRFLRVAPPVGIGLYFGYGGLVTGNRPPDGKPAPLFETPGTPKEPSARPPSRARARGGGALSFWKNPRTTDRAPSHDRSPATPRIPV